MKDRLRNLNVGEVIICGAMTHMCIISTVRAAFDFGFRCLLVSDACATRNLQFGGAAIDASQVHAAFMAALSSPFAQIIGSNELESRLR